jgi:phosphoribosylanthranilate isomerase
MFHIKICGITAAPDAQAAATAGADAIGLNFYPLSPRYVSQIKAEEIVGPLPAAVVRVGVFVNSPSAEVRTFAARLKLDFVQIHGDEPPDFLSELNGLPVIRAFRSDGSFQGVIDYLDQCNRLGCLPHAMLIDAQSPGQFGGTGELADWKALAAARERLPAIPIVLAGGLKPANVAQAIDIVRPAAVDTASGVESAPGKKSAQLIQAFVDAALTAFHPALPE